MRLLTLGAAALCLIAIPAAYADSLVLQSVSGNTYTYEFETSGANFKTGEGFTISGLSGVTGATVDYPYTFAFDASYTATSVTIEASSPVGFFAGDFPSFFTITSTAAEGLAAYVDTGSPAVTGTVGAPTVASTPEPGSLLLLGTGALGVVGLMRKRIVA